MKLRRLSSRITLHFVILMLLGGALTTALVGGNLARTLSAGATRNGMALARTLAGQLGEPIAYADHLAARRLLTHALDGNPDVIYVFVVTPGGSVSDHSFPPRGFPRDLVALAPRHAITRLAVESGPALDLPAPIRDGTLGTVHVGVSLAAAEATTAAAVRNVAATTALAMLAGVLGIFFLAGLVTRPVERLRTAVREIGRGNLGARVRDLGDDEIGELAGDFNAMADRLAGALGELAADRRQLEELVNGIADGVVLMDADLTLMTMNRGFATRLGDAPVLAFGTPHRELSRAAGCELAPGTPTPAERALASGRLETEVVRLRGASGGSERVEEIYAQPLRGEGGAITGVIEVWRDISERKALEASLAQSERLAALGMLASGVAHEVGNPLASIATAVQGLLRRLGPDGTVDMVELREYLEIVQKQVFRCHGVTQRLLGLARLPSPRVATVDAAASLREVLSLIGPQARAQGVAIELRLPPRLAALGEDSLLGQIFLNLALNALQAMPQGGALTVEAGADAAADQVVVTVRDTGPGIPEAIRGRLFKPFSTARASGEAGAGTGLGLFLTHALVEQCGGAISVESESGRGAAFTVRLQRAPAGDRELAA